MFYLKNFCRSAFLKNWMTVIFCYKNLIFAGQQFWKTKWAAYFKGALLYLRQFLATQSPLNMMKNAFYFALKALFALEIFKFLSWRFGDVVKRLDSNKVNFKIYDITTWKTSNGNTHIS